MLVEVAATHALNLLQLSVPVVQLTGRVSAQCGALLLMHTLYADSQAFGVFEQARKFFPRLNLYLLRTVYLLVRTRLGAMTRAVVAPVVPWSTTVLAGCGGDTAHRMAARTT